MICVDFVFGHALPVPFLSQLHTGARYMFYSFFMSTWMVMRNKSQDKYHISITMQGKYKCLSIENITFLV
jgi:hypothetical protein